MQGQEIYLSEVLVYMFFVCFYIWSRYLQIANLNVNVSLCPGFSVLHLTLLLDLGGHLLRPLFLVHM